MAPPVAKKQKVEEKPEEAKTDAAADAEMTNVEAEKPKEPEPPVEAEKNEPESRQKLPKITKPVSFLPVDQTVNVLPGAGNNILTTLTEGGIQHFCAGARANIGISKGRYMFEAKIVQNINLGHSGNQGGNERRHQQKRHLLKIGFSTANSPLVLGSSTTDVCFESDGNFSHNKVRTNVKGRFDRDHIVAVVLNLERESPNFNTISLFKDGVRVCQPQPLPDSLKGVPLYPHISFKGVTVHVNFGAVPLAPLPFKCRMVQEAIQKDVTEVKAATEGKHEVVFPVSLPDEGTFDWLEMFLEKNPSYVELSDRMIADWADKSGIWKQKGDSCNDKPDLHFGIPELDNGSMRNAIYNIAPMVGRNYVVMEVKGNLLKEDRMEYLSRFSSKLFKKKAMVMVGDPAPEFKSRVQKALLKQKQEASDKQFELKKLEEKRKRAMAKKQKELEKTKKKAEKQRLKEAEKIKKKLEFAKKVKEAKEKGEEPPVEEEEKEEEPEEEEPEDEEEEPVEEDPPQVDLSDEEKKQKFRVSPIKDLSPVAMSTYFSKFTVPSKDEGFDEIDFEWARTESKASDFVKSWIQDKKLTTRVEDLRPSPWFQTRFNEFKSTVTRWQAKQNEYKGIVAKKIQAKAAKQVQAKAKAAAAAAALAKKEAAKARGEEVKEDDKVEDEKEEEPEEEEVEVDFGKLDVFAVEDILDVGGGKPLFAEFQNEDWTLLSLRFELHLLAHAFKKDCGDEERLGIFLDHLPFYYNRYYHKYLNTKDFGVDSYQDLIGLINDALFVAPKSVLESQVDAELETPAVFAKLVEEARRYRNLLINLGEESAKLKLKGGNSGGGGNWQQQGNRNWHGQQGQNWHQQQRDGGNPRQGGQQWQSYVKVSAPGKGQQDAGYSPYGGKGCGKAGYGRWGRS